MINVETAEEQHSLPWTLRTFVHQSEPFRQASYGHQIQWPLHTSEYRLQHVQTVQSPHCVWELREINTQVITICRAANLSLPLCEKYLPEDSTARHRTDAKGFLASLGEQELSELAQIAKKKYAADMSSYLAAVCARVWARE